MPILAQCLANITASPSLRRTDTSLFLPFLYLVQTFLPVSITLCCVTAGWTCLSLSLD